MTEHQKKDTLSLSRPKLELTKTVGSGTVKQNFTHGRSKTVTVEVRKTRAFSQADGKMVEVKKPTIAEATAKAKAIVDDPRLTASEREARLRALQSAGEQKHSPLFSPPLARVEDSSGPVAEGEARPRVTISPTLQSEREKNLDAARPAAERVVGKLGLKLDEEEAEREAKKAKLRSAREEPRRMSGKLTVAQAMGLNEERHRSLSSLRRAREKAKRDAGPNAPSEKVFREIVLPETITVQDLAGRMAERTVDVIKSLMKMGSMVTANQTIDADTAELIATEFGHKVKRVTESDFENVLKSEEDAPEHLKPRAPVVTIMGHVDHGKTSLLDALRKTDVVAGEAGGITQHIGAYQVTLNSGQKITFLDTPGHEAFTAMRARGAKVTDIVVLVVAADDGIMEQTKEAISHAKAAHVPIIVAINKIDKQGADPSRVKNELMSYELVPEEFGGDTIVVEVSAKAGTNLDKLESSILVQSEVLELKANPDSPASGAVVEAKIERGRGVVATVLVQRGTLKVGDIVVAGAAWGKVRAISDDKGRAITVATPSMPVEVIGLDNVPEAGDEFAVADSEKTAREIAEYRMKKQRAAASPAMVRTLENFFGPGVKAKELGLVVKADVHGSMEAIAASMQKLSGEEVAVRVMHAGVGAINESDVTLAHATHSIIIGFNVRASAQAKALATRYKVDIRYYPVIYDVVEDIKAALSGMLSPTLKENFLGYAEIRQVFEVSKAGKVAGCMVTEGVVKRGAKVRLLRDNVVIHTGSLKTLKRFKDDAREVTSGMECGMAFENYEDIREGDMIECFEVEEVKRTL